MSRETRRQIAYAAAAGVLGMLIAVAACLVINSSHQAPAPQPTSVPPTPVAVGAPVVAPETAVSVPDSRPTSKSTSATPRPSQRSSQPSTTNKTKPAPTTKSRAKTSGEKQYEWGCLQGYITSGC